MKNDQNRRNMLQRDKNRQKSIKIDENRQKSIKIDENQQKSIKIDEKSTKWSDSKYFGAEFFSSTTYGEKKDRLEPKNFPLHISSKDKE